MRAQLTEHYTGEVWCGIFYHVNANMPRYKVGDRVSKEIKLGSTEALELYRSDEGL